ncbi:MAG: DUF2344 domain-containing protein, partial [Spirulina sp. SIO3F2]|nr:DUF2344 domain-containing protein [Spirulina sp. SIO3F2]
DQTLAQRLRVRMGKEGEFRLLGHLDLVRLLDRVVRRASLPIRFSGGYHPGPRIMVANALSLGMTSSGEVVDFELTEVMEVEAFKTQLAAQLPSEMPIYSVEDVDPKSPSANKLLRQAEYVLDVAVAEGEADWQGWIDQILAITEVLFEKTTKSGKKKQVNLRDRLFTLTVETSTPETAKLHFLGSCQNDGTTLRPEQLVGMFESVVGQAVELLHAHRVQLVLAESP